MYVGIVVVRGDVIYIFFKEERKGCLVVGGAVRSFLLVSFLGSYI